MSGHLTSYYTALQIERTSLDRRAATNWTATTVRSATRLPRFLKVAVISVAIGVVGLGGSAATLAYELTGLPDGLIAERAAENGQATVPARPFDGRPW